LTIHIEAAGFACKSRAMVGSATLAIDESRTDRVSASAIASIAQ
jgi:hypothetical protein